MSKICPLVTVSDLNSVPKSDYVIVDEADVALENKGVFFRGDKLEGLLALAKTKSRVFLFT